MDSPFEDKQQLIEPSLAGIFHVMNIVDTNLIVFMLFQHHSGPEVCRLLNIRYKFGIFSCHTSIEDSGKEAEHLDFVSNETFRNAMELHLLLLTLPTTNDIRYSKPYRDSQDDIHKEH
jgi:hypothetical protein